jgi:hypothetical protein
MVASRSDAGVFRSLRFPFSDGPVSACPATGREFPTVTGWSGLRQGFIETIRQAAIDDR